MSIWPTLYNEVDALSISLMTWRLNKYHLKSYYGDTTISAYGNIAPPEFNLLKSFSQQSNTTDK